MPQHRTIKAVHFDFALRPHGWAHAFFAIGEVQVTVRASYLSDALGDLLRAALALAEGAEQQTVVWVEEPDCIQWVFTRGVDSLRVQINHHEGLYPEHLNDLGVPRFDAECPPAQFYAALYAGADAVLSAHGREGYKTLWRAHDFPATELTSLSMYVVCAD